MILSIFDKKAVKFTRVKKYRQGVVRNCLKSSRASWTLLGRAGKLLLLILVIRALVGIIIRVNEHKCAKYAQRMYKGIWNSEDSLLFYTQSMTALGSADCYVVPLIALMSEAVSSRSINTRLHGAIFLNTIIFNLRRENLTYQVVPCTCLSVVEEMPRMRKCRNLLASESTSLCKTYDGTSGHLWHEKP